MQIKNPKLLREFADVLRLHHSQLNMIHLGEVADDLYEFAAQWELEQTELNTCLNKLLHTPVGYVDPTTLTEFRYSNVISGRIYADGDNAYTPVFTKDQFDDAGILKRPYIEIK